MKYIAIIPARGGSKGIPGKNIYNINGKPLIAYSIEQAISADIFEKVFVNTDDQEIAEISKQFGAEVPFIRPSELASDTATTLDTIKHAIAEYNKICTFDAVFLLQPTSPFRRLKDFNQAKTFMEKGATATASYSPAQEHPSRMRYIENNTIEIVLPEPETLRRQDMKEVFVRNGAIYTFLKNIPETENTLLPDNHKPILMDNLGSINIDEPFDLMLAELVLTHVWNSDSFTH